ncbi:hypothetical protein E6H12_00745 [Candidatus Bathyarchaeota archaeon]|nr:MAG: hypothetical protein E6H12_00745 [Candidatus Bathyarchaeota archaeon]
MGLSTGCRTRALVRCDGYVHDKALLQAGVRCRSAHLDRAGVLSIANRGDMQVKESGALPENEPDALNLIMRGFTLQATGNDFAAEAEK